MDKKQDNLIPISHQCVIEDAEPDGKAFAILFKKKFMHFDAGTVKEFNRDQATYIVDNNFGKSLTQKEYDTYLKLKEEEIILKEATKPENAPKVTTSPDCLDLFIPNKEMICENYYKANPYFMDDAGIFWFWDKKRHCYIMQDEINLFNDIRNRATQQNFSIVGNSFWGELKRALKLIGRQHQPKKWDINYIQFDKEIYHIKTKEILHASPKYFNTCPIPWKIGKTSDTPTMDKLFNDWVGENYVKTLYEIIAYCCYTAYPIQIIICLLGCGRNGKSQFQKILTNFVGKENTCSTDLDVLMDSRFEAFKLYKKLVCSMGETNFGVMKKTSLLKRLVGGDLISYEKKGKDPFDDINFSKIIISSNSLPTSEDTSDGFYRRWLIIDFPNEFEEGTDIINNIPEIEYNNLARKVLEILPELLERGSFTNQGSIEARQERYILASNPLPLFINKLCIRDVDGFISYNELYTTYIHFLKIIKKRRVKRNEFKTALESEGFYVEKMNKTINGENYNSYWIDGLRLLPNLKEQWDKKDKWDILSTLFSYKETEWKKGENCPKRPTTEQTTRNSAGNDIIYSKCVMCGASTSNTYNNKNQPICAECADIISIQEEKV